MAPDHASDEDEEVEVPPEVLEKLGVASESDQQSDPIYRFEVTRGDVIPFVSEEEFEDFDEEKDDGSDHPKPDYASSLEDNEAIFGIMNHVDFEFTNVGEENFPGGVITSLEISGGGVSGRYSFDVERDVPPIPSGGSEEIMLHIKVPVSGIATVRAKLQAKDGEGVIFDHGPNEQNVFIVSFRAVEKEKLIMINELMEIRGLLNDE